MLTGGKSHPGGSKTAIWALALTLAVFAFFGTLVLLPTIVHAQAQPADAEFAQQAGLAAGDPRVLVARIIQVALGLLGTIAVLIVLYAGFIWMTAGGDTERVDRAKKILARGVIGLLLIIFSYAIATFIVSRLIEALDGTGGLQPGAPGTSLGDSLCIGLTASCPAGALGSGIVDAHYPGRNASNIPRNTRVAVTFKTPMQAESFVVGGPDASVAILASAAVVGTSNQFPAKYAASLTDAEFDVVTTDNRTFTFIQKNCSASNPGGCIGSPTENLFYTVAFRGGIDGLKTVEGSAAFAGTFSSGYAWEFQVGTVLDVTPPRVLSAYPLSGSDDTPRNAMVQVTFSEPVDPVSVVSGGLTLATASGDRIDGDALIGNGYRSAEFRTSDACGVNSCGETIYCLPADATIRATAHAGNVPPTIPPGGIIDMAGNALDGDGDGAAQGPTGDDYVFSFSVGDDVDLVPPKIVGQEPSFLEGEIPRDLKISATFSKLMSAASLTTDNVRLVPGGGGAPTNHYLSMENVSSSQGAAPTQSKIVVSHDLFSVNQPYAIDFASGLRDLRQNCFFPGGGQNVCTGSERFCCNGLPSETECGFL